MTIDRKAFRAVYNLIKNGCASEKQAYDMCVAIFWQPCYPEPENTVPDVPDVPEQTVVKGFAGSENTNVLSRWYIPPTDEPKYPFGYGPQI